MELTYEEEIRALVAYLKLLDEIKALQAQLDGRGSEEPVETTTVAVRSFVAQSLYTGY